MNTVVTGMIHASSTEYVYYLCAMVDRLTNTVLKTLGYCAIINRNRDDFNTILPSVFRSLALLFGEVQLMTVLIM